MKGKNKYAKGAHISERKFRELVRLFSVDLDASLYYHAYSADDAHLIRAKTPSCSRSRRPLHRSEATLVF